jgi:hypothetical protein
VDCGETARECNHRLGCLLRGGRPSSTATSFLGPPDRFMDWNLPAVPAAVCSADPRVVRLDSHDLSDLAGLSSETCDDLEDRRCDRGPNECRGARSGPAGRGPWTGRCQARLVSSRSARTNAVWTETRSFPTVPRDNIVVGGRDQGIQARTILRSEDVFFLRNTGVVSDSYQNPFSHTFRSGASFMYDA